MGCDIHMFAEYRRGNTGEWVLDDTHSKKEYGCMKELPDGGRNYQFFSLIAGVRGSEDPLYDKRGLPEDIVRKLVDEHTGNHSHTWLTLFEYKRVVNRAIGKGIISEDCGWVDIIKHCEKVMEDSSAESLLLDEPSLKLVECRLTISFDS